MHLKIQEFQSFLVTMPGNDFFCYLYEELNKDNDERGNTDSKIILGEMQNNKKYKRDQTLTNNFRRKMFGNPSKKM